MSRQFVLDFLQACAADPTLIERFNTKALPELVLHAKSAGYRFTPEELTGVIGSMEAFLIMQRMGETIDAYSSLWPRMWGKPRLQYVVDELYRQFSATELAQFAG